MGKAIAAMCNLIGAAILDGWDATLRLIAVLFAIAFLLWGATTAGQLPHVTSVLAHCIAGGQGPIK
jgi:hypothetical protein